MRTYVRRTLAFLAAGALLIAAAGEVQAFPSSGRNCSDCHTVDRNDAMTVAGYDGMVNLDDVNLPSATDRGLLKYYDVTPGNFVTFSVDVTNGDEKYAVELKRLETGGVMNDAGNRLVFTADPTWTKQTDAGVDYYTQGTVNWGGTTNTHTFELFVDASTPLDTYDLEFAVAGKNGGRWYQDEHFYLNVVPEPASWVLFSCLGLGLVWYGRRRKR